MHTMRASTPVSGPSNPKARSVRPPAVRVRRVRDGENSSNIMVSRLRRAQRSWKRRSEPTTTGQSSAPMTGASQRPNVVTGLPVAPSTQNSTNW